MLNTILMVTTGINTVWNAVNSISIGNVNRKVNVANKNLSHLSGRVETLDRNVKCVENEVYGDSHTPSLLARAIQGSVNKSAVLTQQAFVNTMGVDPWYYQQQVPQQPQVHQVQGVAQPQVMPGVQVPQGVAPVTTNVTVAPPQSQQHVAATPTPPLTEESVKAMITQIIADMAADTQQPQSQSQQPNNNNKK